MPTDPRSSLAAVFDGVPEAVVAVGSDGSLLAVNTVAELRLGVARDHVLGRPLSALMDGWDVDPAEGDWLGRLVGGDPTADGRRVAASARRADGSGFDAELVLTAAGRNGLPAYIVVHEVGGQEPSPAPGGAAGEAVWVDAEGTVVDATDEAARLFGYRRDELIGLPARALLLTPGTADHVGEVALSGRPIRVTARRRDGTAVAIDVMIAPLPTAQGLYRLAAFEAIGPVEEPPVRHGGETVDEGSRPHAPDALAASAQGIAHDLNNDLGAILNLATLVARHVDDPGARADLDAIHEVVEHATNVARRVLTFVRVPPGATLVDIGVVLHDSEALLRQAAGSAVQLVIRAEDGSSTVLAERRAIEDMLVRLVVHARAALPRVAGIELEVGNVALDAWSAAGVGVGPGDHVRIAVSAMPPASASSGEEHEERVTGTDALAPLESVGDTVRRLGGRLDLIAFPRGGPVAAAYLPRVDMAATAAPRGEPDPEARSPRILVVDDSPTVLHVIRRILAGHHYRVDVAESAMAALDTFASAPNDFALVVTDSNLPDISGVELARRCRALRPEVPIVLMSGHAGGVGRPGESTEQDVPFITKPFTEQVLVRVVGQALHAAQAAP